MSKTILWFLLLCLAAPGARIPEQDSRNVDIHDSYTRFDMPVFTSRGRGWSEEARKIFTQARRHYQAKLLEAN